MHFGQPATWSVPPASGLQAAPTAAASMDGPGQNGMMPATLNPASLALMGMGPPYQPLSMAAQAGAQYLWAGPHGQGFGFMPAAFMAPPQAGYWPGDYASQIVMQSNGASSMEQIALCAMPAGGAPASCVFNTGKQENPASVSASAAAAPAAPHAKMLAEVVDDVLTDLSTVQLIELMEVSLAWLPSTGLFATAARLKAPIAEAPPSSFHFAVETALGIGLRTDLRTCFLNRTLISQSSEVVIKELGMALASSEQLLPTLNNFLHKKSGLPAQMSADQAVDSLLAHWYELVSSHGATDSTHPMTKKARRGSVSRGPPKPEPVGQVEPVGQETVDDGMPKWGPRGKRAKVDSDDQGEDEAEQASQDGDTHSISTDSHGEEDQAAEQGAPQQGEGEGCEEARSGGAGDSKVEQGEGLAARKPRRIVETDDDGYVIRPHGGGTHRNASGECRTISRALIKSLFHLPINDAAKTLGIGLTVMKKYCRKLQIPRWPHRKLKSVEELIQKVEGYFEEHQHLRRHHMLKELRDLRSKILNDPSMNLERHVCKLRQQFFKLEYNKRVQTNKQAAQDLVDFCKLLHMESRKPRGKAAPKGPAAKAKKNADPEETSDDEHDEHDETDEGEA